MRAVYLLIVIGFLRRLLRRVLVPSGRSHGSTGMYAVALAHEYDRYVLWLSESRSGAERIRVALTERYMFRIPPAWFIVVVEDRIGLSGWDDLEYPVSQFAEELYDWVAQNCTRFL